MARSSRITMALIAMLITAVPVAATPPSPGSVQEADTVFRGAGEGDRFGAFVADHADLTGDGLADLVVGSPRQGPAGAVHVFSGRRAYPREVDVERAYASFVSTGVSSTFNRVDSGRGGGVGDLNDDGHADLVVSAPWLDRPEGLPDNPLPPGAVYLFYGPLSPGDLIPDATLFGSLPGEVVGLFEVEAGDLNGDGNTDLIVGAPGRRDLGSVYIIYGTRQRIAGTRVLEEIADAELTGEQPSSAGRHLAVGFLNQDDVVDLVVNAELANGAGGKDYIVFGGERIEGTLPLATEADAGIVAAPGDLMATAEAMDLNGDGHDDLAVGAWGATGQRGLIGVFYGPVDWAGDRPLLTADAVLLGERPEDGAGYQVAGGGDINGDGFEDMTVSAVPDDLMTSDVPGGIVYVVLGRGEPLPTVSSLSDADIRLHSEERADRAGEWVASGDVNGDGYADLTIGAPCSGAGCSSRAGAVYLFYGGPCRGRDPLGFGQPQQCGTSVRH